MIKWISKKENSKVNDMFLLQEVGMNDIKLGNLGEEQLKAIRNDIYNLEKKASIVKRN